MGNNGSRATVEGDEVFPEDSEAGESSSGDVGLACSAAVLSGDSEEGVDLLPGGGVDAGHGLVGWVVEVVGEHGGGGLVDKGGDHGFEAGLWRGYSSYLMPLKMHLLADPWMSWVGWAIQPLAANTRARMVTNAMTFMIF